MTYGRGLLRLGVIIASPDCQESGSMLLRAWGSMLWLLEMVFPLRSCW